jgi:hypothetical protein
MKNLFFGLWQKKNPVSQPVRPAKMAPNGNQQEKEEAMEDLYREKENRIAVEGV